MLVEDVDPITRITLNRPDRRNALSLDLMRGAAPALEQAGGRVVVIAGAGAPSRRATTSPSWWPARATTPPSCSTPARADDHGAVDPQPVIAKVHGVATAAGCQLVASCDLAVAETGARFATPGVRIGLFCSTPMVPLTRAIGPKRAMQMLLTGDLIDAATAIEWGLINDAVARRRARRRRRRAGRRASPRPAPWCSPSASARSTSRSGCRRATPTSWPAR